MKTQLFLENLFFDASNIWDSFEYVFLKEKSRARRISPLPAFSNSGRAIFSFNSFVRHAPEFIDLMFASVRKGEYEMQVGTRTEVCVEEKRRTIIKFDWPDRFLLTHFARVLHQAAENLYPDSLYSFRKGRSNALALKNLSAFIRHTHRPLYILRADVKDFGESMDHDCLLSDMQRLFGNSKPLLDLLRKACTFPYYENNSVQRNSKGLPTGHYLQVVFENLYLMDLDRSLETIDGAFYARFGDDLLFASPEQKSLGAARRLIQEEFSKRKLKINLEKSEELLLCDPRRSSTRAAPNAQELPDKAYVEYLGSRVWYHGAIGLTRTKQRFALGDLKRRLKAIPALRKQELNQQARVDILIFALQNCLSDKRFFGSHPFREYVREVQNDRELKELDRWIAIVVLQLALKKGHSRGLFRFISYRELRTRGLPSLLHMKRTNEL